MLVFPPAKINLGLNVVRRRDDGYHDIQSVLVRIPLCDALEAVIDPALGGNEVIFTRTGIDVPGSPDDDLCMKAVRMLQREHHLPCLRVHLHKAIPAGAGLGGGSSDGAHMLHLLDRLCGLRLPREHLHTMAAALGSDVPFFLGSGPQLAEGRGEKLRPVTVDLRGLWLVVVNPGVHVPTAEVYRNTTPSGREVDLEAALLRPFEEWNEHVVNGMEPYVFSAYPAVAAAKETLLVAGAAYAAMSGSGWFGRPATACGRSTSPSARRYHAGVRPVPGSSPAWPRWSCCDPAGRSTAWPSPGRSSPPRRQNP
jgi:4-diphosphocytidyl-2-C-methyl-D-erythritol kinase